jgi:hypothetical protein
MREQRQREHEREATGVRQHRDPEGIGTLRRIAATKIAGPPAQHRSQAETDGNELSG